MKIQTNKKIKNTIMLLVAISIQMLIGFIVICRLVMRNLISQRLGISWIKKIEKSYEKSHDINY